MRTTLTLPVAHPELLFGLTRDDVAGTLALSLSGSSEVFEDGSITSLFNVNA